MFNYDCITRRRPYPEGKKEKKLSETSTTGNKITQDQDNISKEAKVGISIEGTKIPSILTPPPYKNGKTTKVVHMIRHVIPIQVKQVFLKEAIMIVMQETWMKNIKTKKTKNTLNLRL